jgi:glycosyltransferase involved in cell wall biosynthesis
MRILHVIDSLAASGGAETGLAREVASISARHEQAILLLYDLDELSHLFQSSSIEVTSLGLAPGSGNRRWLSAVGPTRAAIRSFRPDVVHTSLFLGNLVGETAARLERVPVVSTLVLSGDRDLLRAYQPGAATWRAEILRRAAGVAARWSEARFRALTEDVRVTNARLLHLDPARIVVIPRGVPGVDGATGTKRAELGLPEGRLVVTVGRIAAQKNQVDLVRAMVTVRHDIPDATLVIVGRAGDAESLVRSEIERLGLNDAVLMMGQSSRVRDILGHADVFGFSSAMEGLGTAVLEAMAAGAPVVAYDIPTVREATDDGRLARLVTFGDVPALAEAIVDTLANPGNQGQAGQAWVDQERSLGEVARRLEELLESARV